MTTIEVGGKPFVDETRFFYRELRYFLKEASEDSIYPISNIFQIFPIKATSDVIEDVVERGNIEKIAREPGQTEEAAGELLNEGDFTEPHFDDQNFGLIALPILELFRASYKVTSDSISMDFAFRPNDSRGQYITFLEPQFGLESNYYLKRFRLEEDRALYELESDVSKQPATIIVDMKKDIEEATISLDGVSVSSLPRPVVLERKVRCCGLWKFEEGEQSWPTCSVDICRGADCVISQEIPNSGGERNYIAYFSTNFFPAIGGASRYLNSEIDVRFPRKCNRPVSGPGLRKEDTGKIYRLKIKQIDETVLDVWRVAIVGSLISRR